MTKITWLFIPLALLLVAACRPFVASAPPEAPTREIRPAQATTPTPPPPKFTPNPDSLTLPPEILNRDRSKGETAPNTRFGPQNKGAVIRLRDGKQVKLPDNVYLEGTVFAVECPAGRTCYEPPYSVFTTGKSYLGVTFDGKVLFESATPGEELAFEPLRRQLR